MPRVKNTSGRKVVQEFFGYGTFEVEPDGIVDVPNEVWEVWQSTAFWGGNECLLKEVADKVEAVDEEPDFEDDEDEPAESSPVVSKSKRGRPLKKGGAK